MLQFIPFQFVGDATRRHKKAEHIHSNSYGGNAFGFATFGVIAKYS